MADLTEVASSWGGVALNFGVIIISILFVGGSVGGFTYLALKWRQYNQFVVRIFERNGFDEFELLKDKAGIFVDSKTKNKRFFMRKMKVGLNPDNVPYIREEGSKVVYLLRTGLKNFHFIRMKPHNPSVTLSVGEEDVNWAMQDYDKAKKMFIRTKLLDYMPYIGLAFTGIIILIMFMYFFKEFGTLKDVAVAMSDAAKSMAQYKTGTAVIGG